MTHATFTWEAFVTQMASAASFNVTAAPYVSDYSRYLPARTPRTRIIANVFAGSALSAIWLIALGAWLATRLGAADGLLALHRTGDVLWPHLGSLLAAVSIAALFTTCGMNAYSAMLTFVTICDSLQRVQPTRALRIKVIVGVMVVWIVVAVGFGGNAVTYVNTMLVIMLYFLMPWTAVNLIDYFVLRKGRYSILDLFRPNGIYGAWGARGLCAYAIGFLVSVPFFVVPDVYTGPIAARLGGVDFGWLVSAVAASLTYAAQARDPHHPARAGAQASAPGEYRLEIGDLLLALVQDQVSFELFQVSQHGLGQALAVLALDEFDQGGVRHMRAVADVRALVDGRDQGRARHEVTQHLDNYAVADDVRQQRVEFMRGAQLEGPITTVFALAFLADVFAQLPQRILVGRLDDFVRQGDFDQPPRREHLAGLLHGRIRHDGAAVALQSDHLVAGECVQHGADPHAADTEDLAELIFDEPGARQQASLGDRHVDATVDVALG